MSLINQVLRDLQQQKKGGGATQPRSLRPKQVARVPYLPLPLVLGGGALVLLCLVWWLAGALSDMMFGFEPVAKPPALQEVVAAEQSLSAEKNLVATEPDQLTVAEREAEPPVAPVAPAVVSAPPEPVVPVEQTPAVKPPTVKPAPVVTRPAVATTHRRKQEAALPREVKTPRPVLI